MNFSERTFESIILVNFPDGFLVQKKWILFMEGLLQSFKRRGVLKLLVFRIIYFSCVSGEFLPFRQPPRQINRPYPLIDKLIGPMHFVQTS